LGKQTGPACANACDAQKIVSRVTILALCY
jgi:hypothetical protein